MAEEFTNGLPKKLEVKIIIPKENINKENIFKEEIWREIEPDLREKEISRIIDFIPKGRDKIIPFPKVELVPGNVKGLLEFMAMTPPFDPNGKPRYLLTSGVAIELITGFRRNHHDLDLVELAQLGYFARSGVDVVTPQQYWVGMQFDPEYLKETAYKVWFKDDEGRNFSVLTVHPAILLVQKLSSWGRAERRPDDTEDASHLFYYWVESLSADNSWNPIIQKALEALPEEQRKITTNRLEILRESTITGAGPDPIHPTPAITPHA